MNPMDSIINTVPMNPDARLFSVDPRFNLSLAHTTVVCVHSWLTQNLLVSYLTNRLTW